ncbi:MAG: hypothetical protein B6244_07920 [Candidatus Cloacimonetes bacterium 4572_55]|nr:MAG: hypothetical protein B6244_07920 [Candidatus Cloacimonetes bacterium 4572_55]
MSRIEPYMESMLGDEGLTDGLTDSIAQIVIDRCENHIKYLDNPRLTDAELASQFQIMRKHIRKINKALQRWEIEKDSPRIRRELSKVWDDHDPKLSEIVNGLSRLTTVEQAANYLLDALFMDSLDYPIFS